MFLPTGISVSRSYGLNSNPEPVNNSFHTGSFVSTISLLTLCSILVYGKLFHTVINAPLPPVCCFEHTFSLLTLNAFDHFVFIVELLKECFDPQLVLSYSATNQEDSSFYGLAQVAEVDKHPE